jgi:hypothetical protein
MAAYEHSDEGFGIVET